MHDSVQGLRDEEHLTVWRENIFNAMALCVARTESFENGSQQMEFAIRGVDKKILTETFEPVGIIASPNNRQ